MVPGGQFWQAPEILKNPFLQLHRPLTMVAFTPQSTQPVWELKIEFNPHFKHLPWKTIPPWDIQLEFERHAEQFHPSQDKLLVLLMLM